MLMGAAGRSLDAADCAECHQQSQRLARSAHADLTCDTCHEALPAGAPGTAKAAGPHPYGMSKPECVTCHQDQAGEYANGVHGLARKAGNDAAPDCGVCHSDAHELVDPKSAAFHIAVPDTCGMCHSEVAGEYKASVHGQAAAHGIAQAPVCTDCHGIHTIKAPQNPSSSVAAANVKNTCGQCHSGVRLTNEFGVPGERVSSYMASYHGLAQEVGSSTVANCASCHGVHNILPSSDPRSTINRANLAKTCGKCHPGASANFISYKVHFEGVAKADVGSKVLAFITRFYIWMIVCVIGGMVLHNLIVLRKKLILHRIGQPRILLRMTLSQRIQHLTLLISFFTLVLTGFALHYPTSWLAALFVKELVRSYIHRVAGVVLIGVSLFHLWYVIRTLDGRRLLKDMLPDWKDVTDARDAFRYYLGWSDQRPMFGRFTYAEKIEYWALVWGVFVMASSGLMLWFKVAVGKHVPGWWIDVALTIHFYEAVLATLAIIVWHWYGVIFDPDSYPMNWAWYDGKMSLEQYQHEHPLDTLAIENAVGAESGPPAPAGKEENGVMVENPK